jgi:hypothetical protein
MIAAVIRTTLRGIDRKSLARRATNEDVHVVLTKPRGPEDLFGSEIFHAAGEEVRARMIRLVGVPVLLALIVRKRDMVPGLLEPNRETPCTGEQICCE